MKVVDIARVCHEVNMAYRESIGEDPGPNWEFAPDWQKASICNGVELHLSGDHGPEASHEAWLKEKIEGGWKYGEVKDAKKLEHPCLVDFKDLPTEQQSKDFIFRAIVVGLKGFLGE